ncbi:MAG: alpha/beta fold hydrolase [Alcanivoracaceae bacterium]|nr:alpha/beta fold hydrolase [Alcanivoracaceae bacterium]
MIDFVVDKAQGKPLGTLLLAHGAGAPMDSDFMNAMTAALTAGGVAVLRFEFPYMAQRRTGGSKRPPDRAPLLLAHFAEALQQAGGEKIFIGGKSMGGRMATMLATEQPCAGVICFGYPFHPPGKADKTRIDHFANMQTATLICQGERDPFGTHADVASYALPDSVQLQWLKDGNHDLAPRRASGLCQQDNIEQAADAAAKWITAQSL